MDVFLRAALAATSSPRVMCRLCQKKETELTSCRKDYKSFVNTYAKDAGGDLTCVTTEPIAVLDEAPVEEVAESAEGEATSGESG